jgi:outer membrane protein assembly factor BamB
VLDAVRRQPIKRLAAELLQLIGLFEKAPVSTDLAAALMKTVQADDEPLLDRYLAAEGANARSASLLALAGLKGGDAADKLAEATDDPSPIVQLAAAQALAELGDRRSLQPLARLIDADDPTVAIQALIVLRAATGQRLGMAGYLSEAERREAINAWRNWVEANAATFAIKHPLDYRSIEAGVGRTLACLFNRGSVVEYDLKGNKTWQVKITRPHACQGLPNGHRLIGSFEDKVVYEYDSRGQQVWQARVPGGPMSVQRLENGHTLVACSDAQVVVEVDEAGQTAWQYQTQQNSRPVDAQRLPNGHTLIALSHANRVIEVNRRGQIVWQLNDINNVQAAQRLSNGTTLVCHTAVGMAEIYDASGSRIWQSPRFDTPVDADYLSSGHVIVVEQATGPQLISPDGTIKRLASESGMYGRADRY